VSCAVNWYWTSFLVSSSSHPSRSCADYSTSSYQLQLTTVTPTSKILLSFVGIGCQGILSLLTLIVLPPLNSTFGVSRVYISMKFVLGACTCCMLLTSDPIILTMLCIAIGMPLAAMDSNPYTMAEEIAEDDSSRGYFIGVLDNMLTIGQVLVAAASGAIIQYMGEGQIGIARMFALFGAFALVIDTVVTIWSIRSQLFAPRANAEAPASPASSLNAIGSGDDRYSPMASSLSSLSLPLLADHD
jgi:MFS family permease